MQVHAFGPSTQERHGKFQSSRPVWSIEGAQEQPSLGSEGNQNQKVDENVFEEGIMFQPQKAAELGGLDHAVLTFKSRTEHGLCYIPPQLRRATEARCVAELSYKEATRSPWGKL